MEELFKIKIKNTEAAGIEIVPVADGVEIIVARKVINAEKPVSKTNSNLEILRAFCSEKKDCYKNDKTMTAELKRFWNFYSPKMQEWKGRKVQPEKLWSRWQDTREGSSVEYN